MGSEAEEKHSHHHQNTTKYYKIKILILIVLTNLLTIFIFTTPNFNFNHINPFPNYPFYTPPETLNSAKIQLAATQLLINDLNQKLNSSNLLVEALLIEISNIQQTSHQSLYEKFQLSDDKNDNLRLSGELLLAIGAHKLPLGYSPRTGSDEVYPSVGAGCLKYQDDLIQYMTYQVHGECPNDDVFAQKLMLRGCEPLPRRRCRAKSPVKYVEPHPLPESLWLTPPETSVVWEPYSCKSYKCLIERKEKPGYFDCKDCFDLSGREKTRWMFDNGGLDYGIDQVLRVKPDGSIRIGLDIGGGTGTFAARMKERNVTILTSTMNIDGPFNNFIASRGLIPIHVSVSERLPFFENTLDLVHSMHVLSNWIPDGMLEFAMYDVYRVLRPGGLFWLDHFFCFGTQLNETYVPMLDRVGFKKIRWNAGMKLDRGIEKNEWYFSALLEKPMT
ncbi:probable methyltransferase At1g29790 [Euphorbia lathyris]|uniref:probable methyltransferase At1g29790 n=1 Tax=Euphorbia lathyris TaxID=212925 RepID=UPI003313F3DF